MDELVAGLAEGKKVVFVAGSEISVASGVPPFRGRSNTLWESHAEKWCTRRKFLEDPLEWWNSFWLKNYEKPGILRALPNRGHEALAHLIRRCPQVRVITHNIDSLIFKTSHAIDRDRAIQVHGSVGTYKCVNPNCDAVNQSLKMDIREVDYRWKRDITQEAANLFGRRSPVKLVRNATPPPPRIVGDDSGVLLSANADSASESDVKAKKKTTTDRLNEQTFRSIEEYQFENPPICAHCSHPISPQALLLDEDYASSPFCRREEYLGWLEEADIIVFAGASLATGVACDGLERAAARYKSVYKLGRRSSPEEDLAVVASNRGVPEATRILNALRIIPIVGFVEQSLSMLAFAVDRAAQMHAFLRSARIAPPLLSPSIARTSTPGDESVGVSRGKKIATLEDLPMWCHFAPIPQHVNIRSNLSRRANQTVSLTPLPFPLSDSDESSDDEDGRDSNCSLDEELALDVLQELRSGGVRSRKRKRKRASRKRSRKGNSRRRRIGRPPRYPAGDSRREKRKKSAAGKKSAAKRRSRKDRGIVVRLPWSSIPKYAEDVLRASAGRRRRDDAVADADDALSSNDEDDYRNSHFLSDNSGDLEDGDSLGRSSTEDEEEGVLGTNDRDTRSHHHRYDHHRQSGAFASLSPMATAHIKGPTSRGGFFVDTTPRRQIRPSGGFGASRTNDDDAASILAMLHSPRSRVPRTV